MTLTTTIGQIWASRIVVPGHNIVLNDSLDDFSIPGRPNGFGYAPSSANYVQAGKRPQSSSCPYILELSAPALLSPGAAGAAGAPELIAGGAAGGSTIISCNVQVIRNMVDYGMGPGGALAFRRLHNQLLPDATTLEQGTDRGAPVQGWAEGDAAALRKRGHTVEWIPRECGALSVGRGSETEHERAITARAHARVADARIYQHPRRPLRLGGRVRRRGRPAQVRRLDGRLRLRRAQGRRVPRAPAQCRRRAACVSVSVSASVRAWVGERPAAPGGGQDSVRQKCQRCAPRQGRIRRIEWDEGKSAMQSHGECGRQARRRRPLCTAARSSAVRASERQTV